MLRIVIQNVTVNVHVYCIGCLPYLLDQIADGFVL